ncbi:unnamed protein product [Orchesella dallaii]|uniref:SHSP domain-containing protein n=1 Tax=Orchesella dallaii TaxID=48710 RepID=A0ABP1RBI3_9HEXA
MSFFVERDPLGLIHPAYRRRQLLSPNWDIDFVRPALETMNTLNQLINLGENQQPRTIQSLASQRADLARDKFEIKMEVQQFAPEELDVKMVNNFIIVEGKHEEKEDEQGYISRHFVRRYQLPPDVKPETVKCNLSSDGVLHIEAPRMIEDKSANPTNIPINFTGKPAVKEAGEQQQANESGAAGVGEKNA